MRKNGIAGASLLQKNYDDLWRSGYLVCVLVLVSPIEYIRGSRKAAVPAYAVTVLRVPRRPGECLLSDQRSRRKSALNDVLLLRSCSLP